ncbi:hypothetical protein SAMN02745121_06137 [Nannocystis exedens]|uniref:Uncharacterized protein n=1 Tax=Nannocystis exedens TaxID=54 RepID=A0A1I2ELL9_9BACT|nr:hypothetical protein NAEX_07032 [Nannocystis exedens]SFE93912.1 hypothetical protein SAMN02745121_06137 [Nannocystis exedens]
MRAEAACPEGHIPCPLKHPARGPSARCSICRSGHLACPMRHIDRPASTCPSGHLTHPAAPASSPVLEAILDPNGARP